MAAVLMAIIITIFIATLNFLTSYSIQSTDANYEACSSVISCGKFHNIGYPFSVNGSTPDYCGRSLVLHCPRNGTDDYPLLRIDDDDDGTFYQVLGITNFTISFALNQSNCLVQPLNLSSVFLQRGLTYSSTTEDFILYYNCKNRSALQGAASVTCSERSYYRFVNLFNGNSCESIKIPALKKEINEYLNGNGTMTVKSLLQKGFEMDYPVGDFQYCSSCKLSGGICGSDVNMDFVCFCKDSPHSYVCSMSSSYPKSGSKKLRVIIGSASSAVAICIMIILAIIIRKGRSSGKLAMIWKRRTTESKQAEAFLRIYGSLAPKRYTYLSIKKITHSFKHKLGEGGYATVYKGKLSDGRLVAVKLFKQFKANGQDFINEVSSIGRTNHVNIVALLGFCFEGGRRALLYEFMPNGSLEKFTFHYGGNSSLPWETLFNIAQGIAKGLDYLHQGCNERILHFDIKPHNILLDEQFQPKISDFGLARLCPQQESSISMMETRGTIGYIAPEVYCRSFGNVSHKSDVYSYGIMVLDLVSGRINSCANAHPSSELYFPKWVYNQLEIKEEDTVDVIIENIEKCMQRKMILVSLWCVQMHPSNRPSMSQVVELLNGSLESIPMPPKPFLSSPTRLAPVHSSETLPTE